jgi:hypothetical protein
MGRLESPLRVSPVPRSPLSSATTLFQTATKGGSGSAVKDENPLEVVPETTK